MISAMTLLVSCSLQQPFHITTDEFIQNQERTQTKMLLAPGTQAPDFTVEKWGGGDLKLSLSKDKVVVLTFWSTMMSMPEGVLKRDDKIFKATKNQGVDVLDVCIWDDRPNYVTWITKNATDLAVTFGYDPTPKSDDHFAKKFYQVSDLPTTYVIDKEGKVAEAISGYHDAIHELRMLLKNLA